MVSKLSNYGNLVMFSHSIFSLPFGLLAMVFAYGSIPPLKIFVWIVVALLTARNGANAFNRIADYEIDKKNPRTSRRDIPMGRVKLNEAYGITSFCFTLLTFAAWQLNSLCLILLPFAIALFIFYSYSKRLTWLCHFILGICCGGAPVGAYIAVTGTVSLLPLFLGGAVTFWIAGFDIIYATQDIDFDRANNIYSVPARFGFEVACLTAKLSHAVSVCILACVPYFVPELGLFYYAGLIIIAGLLCVEHYNINPRNSKKMRLVSYSINQVISLVYLFFTWGDFFYL